LRGSEPCWFKSSRADHFVLLDVNAQIKSQVLGLSLAAATAIGCIAYEKVVKNFSLSTIIFISTCFYLPMLILMLIFDGKTTTGDIGRLCADRELRWYGLIYWITWITTPIWYVITKRQSVMVGSVYEVKYIFMLAAFYLFFGSKPMTLNLSVGICLALVSIYFISKS